MFRQIHQSSLTRAAHTSQPRFKRLPQITASERQSSAITLHQPTHTSTHATLDNAKENLLYQTHLMKVRSACKLDETTIVGKYLGSIRKDYDQTAKETARGLSTLQLKRKDIDFLKSRNKAMQEQRQEADKLMIRKENEVVAMREKFQEASMQTKILENIITRMKKDEIHYKQLGRIRDEQLKRKMKDHKLLEEKLIHEEEKLQKLMNTRDQCKSAYDRNKQIREQKFHDFQGGISGVRERDQFLEERRVRTYQLQSIELNDTLDEKNIHMRQITLASKVADCLLEDKVARLIESYSTVQGAFHLVRAKTGISEPQLLTAKFFSYEQTAEGLLESIGSHEQRIRELTAKKTALTAKYQELMNESYAIADSRNTEIKSYDDHFHEKQTCVKEINEKKLLVQEIRTWVDKKLLDLHAEKPIKSLPIQGKFIQLCRFLAQNIKKCQNIDWKARKSSLISTKKRRGYETAVDEPSLLVNECSLNESALMDEENIRSSRQVAKKGFSIKHFKRQSVNPSPK